MKQWSLEEEELLISKLGNTTTKEISKLLGRSVIAVQSISCNLPDTELCQFIRLSEVVLMQFTGLTDKSGKEIYEGDIVESQHFHKSLVQFKSGMFLAADTLLDQSFEGIYADNEWEVVGNIYENQGSIVYVD